MTFSRLHPDPSKVLDSHLRRNRSAIHATTPRLAGWARRSVRDLAWRWR